MITWFQNNVSREKSDPGPAACEQIYTDQVSNRTGKCTDCGSAVAGSFEGLNILSSAPVSESNAEVQTQVLNNRVEMRWMFPYLMLVCPKPPHQSQTSAAAEQRPGTIKPQLDSLVDVDTERCGLCGEH